MIMLGRAERGFAWETMDFTIAAGTRMTGKEKLIAARDRAVIAMKEIMVTGVADIETVPVVRESGSLSLRDWSSDMGSMS
jgi:hypothetical protein